MDKLVDVSTIDGVVVTSLKQIHNSLGDIFHVIKKSSPGFFGFGEVYISSINKGMVKGWKKHLKMTLNLTVISGETRFVIFDDRPSSKTKGCFAEIVMSLDNYCRLTVPPGLWLSFEGLGEHNQIINVADIEHDPLESESAEINKFKYY